MLSREIVANGYLDLNGQAAREIRLGVKERCDDRIPAETGRS